MNIRCETQAKEYVMRKTQPAGAPGHRHRMFKKFLESDLSDVNIRDIIEMLLYFPIRVRDTRDAAVSLYERFNEDIDIILNSDSMLLCQTEGIGNTCAEFLNLVGEVVARLNQDAAVVQTTDRDYAYENFLTEMYSYSQKDELWAVYLGADDLPLSKIRLDTDYRQFEISDFLTLVSDANKQNATSFAIAHFTAELQAYPSSDDARMVRIIKKCMSYTHYTNIKYFVVNAESVICLDTCTETHKINTKRTK